jgi:anti-sigma B factor antagonist
MRVNFTVSAEIVGTSALLCVVGELDILTAPYVREELAAIYAHGVTDVVLDMSAVTFIDSTGLAVLLGALKRARSRNTRFAVAAVQPAVMKVLMITKLTKVFPMFDTVDAATAA